MSLAFGTQITTPEGLKAIENFQSGDTASAYTANGEEPKQVIFSQGTGPEQSSVMIYLGIDERDLIVTPDQPMVLFDKTIKLAHQLIPDDQLFAANNQPATVRSVRSGRFNGGVHHIAIDNMERDGDHLIIANGIVCGDYFMEINGGGE